MKITVVSDTHGNFDVLHDIITSNLSSDVFIHLGDGEHEYEDIRSLFYDKAFVYVKGNCDYGNYQAFSRLEFCGHIFYICHGHRFQRDEMKNYLAATASINGCDVALFGHTHIPCNETVNGIRMFNPGSASLPRGGHKPSYGIITIDENTKTADFIIKEL